MGSIVLCSGRLCVCVCAIPSAVGSTTVADASCSNHPYVASATPLLVVVCLLVFVFGVRLLPLLLFLLLCCLLLLEQLLHVFCPGSLTESIQNKQRFHCYSNKLHESTPLALNVGTTSLFLSVGECVTLSAVGRLGSKLQHITPGKRTSPRSQKKPLGTLNPI